MLQVGDRVKVKAKTGGPDIVQGSPDLRLRLWGCVGKVVFVNPELDRPIVVFFASPDLPAMVRFWEQDLREVTV